MKKVSIVTTTRADYGCLRWLMSDINQSELLDLQLIVTGTHLSPEHGLTYKSIEADGFKIDKKVEYLLSSQSSNGIAKSMGLCGISFSDAFSELEPDLLVVVGDRYELLPICSTALVMGIPIAHISGGDVTEGAIDNQIRNAITMLADIHFAGSEQSKENIVRMTGLDENVFTVGESSLENFIRTPLLSKKELSKSLQIDCDKQWVLVTLHPETKESIEYNIAMLNGVIEALFNIPNIEIIITQSNADLGGVEFNSIFREWSQNSANVHFFTSLGSQRYMSLLYQVLFLIGNSSSGIVEAPFVGVPVINIGNRQKGRHLSKNVIQVAAERSEIGAAINRVGGIERVPDWYFGRGNTSKMIIEGIVKYLYKDER